MQRFLAEAVSTQALVKPCMTNAALRLAVHLLMPSSIVILMADFSNSMT